MLNVGESFQDVQETDNLPAALDDVDRLYARWAELEAKL